MKRTVAAPSAARTVWSVYAILGTEWHSMDIHRDQWTSIEIQWYPRNHRNPLISMEIIDMSRIYRNPMDIHGFPWISMKSTEMLWISPGSRRFVSVQNVSVTASVYTVPAHSVRSFICVCLGDSSGGFVENRPSNFQSNWTQPPCNFLSACYSSKVTFVKKLGGSFLTTGHNKELPSPKACITVSP